MTSTPTKPVDNVVIATKGLQDRNTNIIVGTTVENKGKFILTKELLDLCRSKVVLSKLLFKNNVFDVQIIVHGLPSAANHNYRNKKDVTAV